MSMHTLICQVSTEEAQSTCIPPSSLPFSLPPSLLFFVRGREWLGRREVGEEGRVVTRKALTKIDLKLAALKRQQTRPAAAARNYGRGGGKTPAEHKVQEIYIQRQTEIETEAGNRYKGREGTRGEKEEQDGEGNSCNNKRVDANEKRKRDRPSIKAQTDVNRSSSSSER